jgi:hypothetical protein
MKADLFLDFAGQQGPVHLGKEPQTEGQNLRANPLAQEPVRRFTLDPSAVKPCLGL